VQPHLVRVLPLLLLVVATECRLLLVLLPPWPVQQVPTCCQHCTGFEHAAHRHCQANSVVELQ
jgi:hypothetical protein